MNAATVARQGAALAKLLVIDEGGSVSHRHASDLPALLRHGDLVIANDAATLPASLHGRHAATGRPVEVRLAGHRSLATRKVGRFTAVVFGAGDYRTPTEHRESPPALHAGDALLLGPLTASVVAIPGHPRLIELQFTDPPDVVWEGLARHGRPIQYAYVPEPLAIWDTWTCLAGLPVAFEAPSAGFMLNWAMLRAFRERGVRFATITHAAGISSTGDDELDELLPLDEPYTIPPATVSLIQRTTLTGGRIIAIGTTVVRAMEDCVRTQGRLKAGAGLATIRLGPGSPVQVVDAVVSGVHDRSTSHYQLLRAFQTDAVLERMTSEADERGYQAHEFGDSVLISRWAPAAHTSAFATATRAGHNGSDAATPARGSAAQPTRRP